MTASFFMGFDGFGGFDGKVKLNGPSPPSSVPPLSTHRPHLQPNPHLSKATMPPKRASKREITPLKMKLNYAAAMCQDEEREWTEEELNYLWGPPVKPIALTESAISSFYHIEANRAAMLSTGTVVNLWTRAPFLEPLPLTYMEPTLRNMSSK